MTLPASSRRDALRAGALAAGAIALGGLASPLRAAAQADPEIEDLRDFLSEAIAREQISALAYAEAGQAGGVDAALESSLETLRTQEQAHVNALTSALESIGYDAPDAPSDPGDNGVFDGVEGIDDDTATTLTDLLATVGEPTNLAGYLDLLVDIETGLIRFYLDNAPGLESEDLRTTCAQIAANQAQHLVVVRQANEEALADALVIDLGAAGAEASEDE